MLPNGATQGAAAIVDGPAQPGLRGSDGDGAFLVGTCGGVATLGAQANDPFLLGYIAEQLATQRVRLQRELRFALIQPALPNFGGVLALAEPAEAPQAAIIGKTIEFKLVSVD